MSINKVYVGIMSPTGGVKKTAMSLIEGFKKAEVEVSCFNFLTPLERRAVPSFTKDDLVVFCYPVFAGRMPKSMYLWDELEGNGAKAVAASVYGNRACDDATREACDFLKGKGFSVVGAAELVAEHSLERRLAAGRPDEADKSQLEAMSMHIISTLDKNDLGALNFEATGPYKPYSPAVVPEVVDRSVCKRCHTCSKICPMSIIERTDSLVAPENFDKCMGCLACVAKCPEKNRDLPPAAKEAVKVKMQMVYEKNMLPKAGSLRMGQY